MSISSMKYLRQPSRINNRRPSSTMYYYENGLDLISLFSVIYFLYSQKSQRHVSIVILYVP